MAKRNNSVAFKGVLYTDNMEVHEYDKKSETTAIYDLLKELKNFNEKEITIMIKEDFPVIEKGQELGDTSGEE